MGILIGLQTTFSLNNATVYTMNLISMFAAEDESNGRAPDGGVSASVYAGDGDPGAGGAGTGGARPHQHAGRQEWEPSHVQL